MQEEPQPRGFFVSDLRPLASRSPSVIVRQPPLSDDSIFCKKALFPKMSFGKSDSWLANRSSAPPARLRPNGWVEFPAIPWAIHRPFSRPSASRSAAPRF
jgi:hypothetical protein